MRFEKCNQRNKQFRFMCSETKLLCPNSGQFEEPLRPTLVSERCR